MRNEDDIVTGEFEAVELDAEGNLVVPKVSEEWLFKMKTAARRLQKNDKFELEYEESFRPVPDVLKEHVESAAGMVAAPTVASFYSVTDGFEMSWLRKDDSGEYVPGGRIHLYGFAEVFGSWLGHLWGEHPEDASEESVDFTWEIRGFDGANEDEPHSAVMHVPEMLPTYALYWHAPHGKSYRLRVDFLEYLQCLTETCGLHGWQYMVCAPEDLRNDDVALAKIQECTRLMAELFPDVDMSCYTIPALDTSNEAE